MYYERSPAETSGPGLANSLLMRRTIRSGMPRSCMRIPDGSPRPLLTRWARRSGELEAVLASDDERPAVHLAARPGVLTAGELARAVRGTVGRYSPFAVYLPRGDPGRLAPVRDGQALVQDEGSQLVARALTLAPVDGDTGRWLDLCAGPGGKTALLAGLGLQCAARVTAVEPSPHRADLVAQNTRGLPVELLRVDGRHTDLDPGFDRVLVDAPCTGLGALRRRPEARWRRQPADVAALAKLQRELLSAAIALTRPGGVVLYATCSPHLAETVGAVADALRRHPVHALDTRPLFEPVIAGLGRGPTFSCGRTGTVPTPCSPRRCAA